MPDVECGGDFIRALALLASSVEMSWMPMSLIHGALSHMLSSSARQPQLPFVQCALYANPSVLSLQRVGGPNL